MDTQPLNPREGNENPQDPVSPYVPVRVPRDLRNIFDPKTSCISLGNRLTKAIAGHGTNEAASLVQLMRNGRLGFVPTPKESQAIGQRLSRDEDGMMLLARLIFDGKLSNFVPAPKESQAIVQCLIEKNGAGLLVQLMLNDKLPGFVPDGKQIQTIAQRLIEKREAALLGQLMLFNKLPGFVPDGEQIQAIAQRLIEKRGVGLLGQLMRNGVLNFVPSEEESQAIGQRLIEEGGAALLGQLVLACKLPGFVPDGEQFQAIARALLDKKEVTLLGQLVLANKLPNFGQHIELSNRGHGVIARALLGKREMTLLVQLMLDTKLIGFSPTEEQSQAIAQFLIEKNEMILLAQLMLDGGLPNFVPAEEQFQAIAQCLIEKSEAALLGQLVLAGKFLNFVPAEEQSRATAKLLLNQKEAALLGRLILGGKLPNFVPSEEESLAIIRCLIEKNEAALLGRLVRDGKLPNFVPAERQSRALTQFLLNQNEVTLLVQLMRDGKLPNFVPAERQSRALTQFLLNQKGAALLVQLMLDGKLPNFVPTQEESQAIIRYLIEEDEAALLGQLMLFNKLPGFVPDGEQSQTIAKSMLSGNKVAVDSLLKLDKSMLPHLNTSTLEEVKARATKVKERHEILQAAITEALGKFHPGQGHLILKEAREIWQMVANRVAADCFGADGRVDVGKLEMWRDLFGKKKIFEGKPYSSTPHTELMRSQIYRVCEYILHNRNGAMDELNAASDIIVGPHGRAILDIMSQYGEPLSNPAVAILASLFTSHRQGSLPACAMHSSINAEIRNHLERLIKTYVQMFGGDQFTFPSGYAVKQQPIENGFITVDLKNGGEGKTTIFKNIESGDPQKIKRQKEMWRQEGIVYTESTDEAEKYKLRLPVYNLNDVLFAHFFRASNFGNGKIESNANYGTLLLYAGHKGFSGMFKHEFGHSFDHLDMFKELRKQAEAQKKQGNCYMRVNTQDKEGGHAENIDIDAILAIDPDAMEPGKIYPIGDRNWISSTMHGDIPRLAIRAIRVAKRYSESWIYKFGTWENGIFYETLKPYDNSKALRIYATDIEHHDASFWQEIEQGQPAP